METIVTHGDVKILKKFNVSEKLPYHNRSIGYHTGVDIQCKEVFSGFPGTVILVSRVDQKTFSVIVQYNSNHAFAYCNLTSVDVALGANIDTDDKIGDCNKFAHIEYLTKSKTAKFKVMVNKQVFYKHDPLDILLNGYESMIDYSQYLSFSQSFLRNTSYDEVDDGS